MGIQETNIGGAGREFPSTDWTHLLSLRDPAHPAYAKHLGALLQRYWKPAYHYIRAIRRTDLEEAKDLTQEFFTRLLQKRYLEHLSRERGSFRGYLKTALKHFVIDVSRAEQARKPTGEARLYHFDEAEAEWTSQISYEPDITPERAFDQEWARSLFREAIDELEKLLTLKRKEVYFKIFRDYYLGRAQETDNKSLATAITRTGHTQSMTYEDIAQAYHIQLHDIRNHLKYAREQLLNILRKRVEPYVDSPDEAERELKFLFES